MDSLSSASEISENMFFIIFISSFFSFYVYKYSRGRIMFSEVILENLVTGSSSLGVWGSVVSSPIGDLVPNYSPNGAKILANRWELALMAF